MDPLALLGSLRGVIVISAMGEIIANEQDMFECGYKTLKNDLKQSAVSRD